MRRVLEAFSKLLCSVEGASRGNASSCRCLRCTTPVWPDGSAGSVSRSEWNDCAPCVLCFSCYVDKSSRTELPPILGPSLDALLHKPEYIRMNVPWGYLLLRLRRRTAGAFEIHRPVFPASTTCSLATHECIPPLTQLSVQKLVPASRHAQLRRTRRTRMPTSSRLSLILSG